MATDKRNQFASLRLPGIAGHLYTGGGYTRHLKIYDKAGHVVIFNAVQVRPEVWILGWQIKTPALISSQEPWEGAGYFKTFEDAVLWITGELLARDSIDEVPTLRRLLQALAIKFTSPTLF